MKRLCLLLALLVVVGGSSVGAKEQSDKKERPKGYLTGSFETNSIYYVDDAKTNAIVPDDRFGSNNYLKLDYYRGRFSAGVQAEAYLPVLQGYPTEL